jgi:uncharacterized protein DUF4276
VFAVLGEDASDVSTVRALIQRIAGAHIKVLSRGYTGCGEMLRKGAKQLQLFAGAPHNCKRFVICYDSDGKNPARRYQDVVDRVIAPSGIDARICIVVPVQEVEAWILADLPAVTNVISSWKPKPYSPDPEDRDSPKEFLQKLSRKENHKPRYINAVHNEQIAKHVSIDLLFDRCTSFRPLWWFASKGHPNYPCYLGKG